MVPTTSSGGTGFFKQTELKQRSHINARAQATTHKRVNEAVRRPVCSGRPCWPTCWSSTKAPAMQSHHGRDSDTFLSSRHSVIERELCEADYVGSSCCLEGYSGCSAVRHCPNSQTM